jgi:hypothetical protein
MDRRGIRIYIYHVKFKNMWKIYTPSINDNYLKRILIVYFVKSIYYVLLPPVAARVPFYQ